MAADGCGRRKLVPGAGVVAGVSVVVVGVIVGREYGMVCVAFVGVPAGVGMRVRTWTADWAARVAIV